MLPQVAEVNEASWLPEFMNDVSPRQRPPKTFTEAGSLGSSCQESTVNQKGPERVSKGSVVAGVLESPLKGAANPFQGRSPERWPGTSSKPWEALGKALQARALGGPQKADKRSEKMGPRYERAGSRNLTAAGGVASFREYGLGFKVCVIWAARETVRGFYPRFELLAPSTGTSS